MKAESCSDTKGGKKIVVASILIGGAIFAYAGWALVRHMKKAPKECVLAALCLATAMYRVRPKNREDAFGGNGVPCVAGNPVF